MVKSAVDKYGKLDLLVSNAAILIAKQVTDFSAKNGKNDGY